MRIHSDLPMNRKILEFYDVILQNDIAGPSDDICTDTSGLYDYPFNLHICQIRHIRETGDCRTPMLIRPFYANPKSGNSLDFVRIQ